ncbi:MAG: ABC transporter permease [Treponema sp.]|jgi:lipoprotein-releasing system permease protein|nr:ABC transporter permease [Treponema sp.]
MPAGWIGFVAARYIAGRRRNRSSPAPVLAVLGIATGVLALTVIIAVMNGFQLGFIESILEISSYHIRVEPFPGGEEGESLLRRLRAVPELTAAVPFMELQGIARGNRNGQQGVVVRGLPPDALDQDPGMAAKLEFEDGSFDLSGKNNILLGSELAQRLSARLGDEITLVFLAGLFSPEAEDFRFRVSGIFRSGFYEYDLGWAFINIDKAGEMEGGSFPPEDNPGRALSLGIKLKNRWQDMRAAERVRELLQTEGGFPGAEVPAVHSWREYFSSFFGALRTDKLLMFILVGLIFIVVGLNIFQAQRRSVLERREEIGLLRAVGATGRAVRLVFVWDGCIIGLAGAGLGLALGLLIACNIGAFFSLLEGGVNGLIRLINRIAAPFLGAEAGLGEGFAIFSPRIFYIKEIPSRLIPHEVLLIWLFGFLSALLASWFASAKVSRTRPAEVLRYE